MSKIRVKTVNQVRRKAHGGIDQVLERAMAFHGSGHRKEAEVAYRKILEKFPRHAGALRVMAILAHETDRDDEALDFARRSVECDPDFASAHANLAQLLALKGEAKSAVFHFAEAARLSPYDVESRLEQARLLSDNGEDAEALAIYEQASGISPTDPRAHRGRGKMLAALGRKEEAADAMRRAAACAPDDAITILHVATILTEIGYSDEAVAAFERAIALDPSDFDAIFSFANLLRDRGEIQRAVDTFSRAIEINPEFAAAYSNLGNILTDEAMIAEAIACTTQAVTLDPSLVEAHNNLGSALQTACRPADAVQCYEKGLALRPNDDAMLWNLALCLLAVGRIEEGWDIYGYGFTSGQRNPCRPFPGLLWQGEDLTGKTIMIWREQGIGDDLRFSTCFHEIVAEAGHVIIETVDRLVPLYQRTWPNATVRAETGRSTGLLTYGPGEVDFDYAAPAGILASLRRRTIRNFPRTCRPLIADPDKRAEARSWLSSLGNGPKIGLTWRSGIRNPVRDIVATTIEDWAPLFALEGVSVINLQFGKPEDEIREAEEKFGLKIHQMPGLDTHNDLDGTAALTAALDVTTGLWNAAIEMAGALGVPGMIYMPGHHPMQLGTEILPWHPTLQVTSILPGFEHQALVERIVSDISRHLASRSA